MLQSVAYAVVHDNPPRVFLAADIDVLHRVLAFEVVARTDPGRMDSSQAQTMREALMEERWADAVLEWMGISSIAVDVYTHLGIFTDEDLPADLIGAQLQFTRLFQG